MIGLDKMADLAEEAGDPGLALRTKLTNAALEGSSSMMKQAWAGWGNDKGSNGSADDGMGCFLNPLEKTLNVVNAEAENVINNVINNGLRTAAVEDLYRGRTT